MGTREVRLADGPYRGHSVWAPLRGGHPEAALFVSVLEGVPQVVTEERARELVGTTRDGVTRVAVYLRERDGAGGWRYEHAAGRSVVELVDGDAPRT